MYHFQDRTLLHMCAGQLWGPLISTVSCSWPWGSQLDHRETYAHSSLRAGCLLLSGLMVLPDPSLNKAFKDQAPHFLVGSWCWLTTQVSLYQRPQVKQHVALFWVDWPSHPHTKRPICDMLFCHIFLSANPSFLHILSLLSIRLPWWHLPSLMSSSPRISFKAPYTTFLEKVTLISPDISFYCKILTSKWV